MKMRVAIIGCGSISSTHIKALIGSGEEIAALCDIEEEKAFEKKSKYELNSAVYTDYKKMLDEVRPDSVHICTPHYLHAEMAVEALGRDINVLCEKPLAISVRDCEAVVEAASKSKASYGVCLQNRYEPNMKKLREMAESIGIEAAFGTVVWKRNEDYYSKGAWRGRWDTEGGGVMINQALHTLDLMQWICGMPEYVTSSIDNYHLKDAIEVEDTASAVFELPDGRKFNFFATTAGGVDFPVQIRARLNDRRIVNAENNMMTCGKEIISTDEVTGTELKSVWGGCHRLLIEDFYDCVRTGRHFAIDAPEASKVIRLILSMYASDGSRIHVL
ncbi:MAG: Gfo/Idh/MocA family oxidoreductase [Clostridia bacterium]|nr:Gfo/Idh/MocA family oxidoreductase [Clostridia bacterium]